MKVVASLVAQEWEVFLPTFGNGCCDVIACKGNQIRRIEVKYVGRARVSGAFEVALRQVRANRSDMIVKKFNSANADILAVYVAPLDAVVFLPTMELHGHCSVSISRRHLETCHTLG